ncbi:MAG TPA: nitroreductase/quinone reductase family protein, partial [Ramlibacter sp.]|nr:nitroreductase/quinone reductase family protein [Ramlibacter sp.]
ANAHAHARASKAPEMMPKHPDVQYLYLTTTGRRTGLPREIEIWFTERAGRFYVIAEHGERANWVRNIRAAPHVQARVGDRHFAAHARLIDDGDEPELARAVKALSDAKYGWSDGLIAEITPDEKGG